MSSDSDRPGSETPEKPEPDHGDNHGDDAPGADDDLAALSSTLESLPPEDRRGEYEDEELGGVPSFGRSGSSAPGRGRVSSIEGDDDDKLDLGHLLSSSQDVIPPAPRVPRFETAAEEDGGPVSIPGKSSWAMPLMVGLGVGVAVGAVMFGASASRQSEPFAAVAVGAPEGTPGEGAAAIPSGATVADVSPAHSDAAGLALPSDAPGLAIPADSPRLAAATPTPNSGVAAQPSTPPDVAARPAASHGSTSSGAGSVRQPPSAAPAAPAPPELPEGASQPVLKLTPAGALEPPVAPVVPAKPEQPVASAKQARSVDALLDEALAPEARKQELAAQRTLVEAEAELPLRPPREGVTQTMSVLTPALRGCAMGQSGVAHAIITVRNDGGVASVRINGAPFAGTASGRCMEGVIRRGKFPKFRQPTVRMRFPLNIQ